MYGNDMFQVGDMQAISPKVNTIYGEHRPYLYLQPWLWPVAKATSNYLCTCCVNTSQLAIFIIMQVPDIKLLFPRHPLQRHLSGINTFLATQ